MIQSWLPAVAADVFAMAILAIILLNFSIRQKRLVLPDQILFHQMLIANIVLLFLDSGTWLLNGQTFQGAYVLNLLCTVCYYLLTPLMSVLYCAFCDVKMNVPLFIRKRLIGLYSVLLPINAVFVLLSIRHGLLFSLGTDNVYRRGSMLWLSFVFSYCLLAVMFARLMAFRRHVRSNADFPAWLPNRHSVRSLLLFPVAPLIGGIVLVLDNQITTVWLATMFSLLIIFVNTQNSEIFTDALTGLFNRRQASIYLWNLLQDGVRRPNLSLTVIDINNFKLVNDLYGHLAGDNALRATAQTLQEVCGDQTFCSRYGGDEFVIIIKEGDRAIPEAWLHKINGSLAMYSQAQRISPPLSISAGTAIWSEGYADADAFFRAADDRLYANKALFKQGASTR
ncbi:MAG TPA: GGDEF domain-containing protein [Candidatus Limiplasma sp.]|nr:GGDEF domain-containing protein [Candidatus Limiplasma sp.]HPS82227.1 GGDEF domain-containing protein [Candidatus Limiplasma sp.]